MPHRSIIRINRNQSRRGGHKIISLVCLYIILSIIFSDSNKRVYFIISFSIVFSAVCFYICIVRNKTIIDTQDISDIDSSIEDSTDYISDDDIIGNITVNDRGTQKSYNTVSTLVLFMQFLVQFRA